MKKRKGQISHKPTSSGDTLGLEQSVEKPRKVELHIEGDSSAPTERPRRIFVEPYGPHKTIFSIFHDLPAPLTVIAENETSKSASGKKSLEEVADKLPSVKNQVQASRDFYRQLKKMSESEETAPTETEESIPPESEAPESEAETAALAAEGPVEPVSQGEGDEGAETEVSLGLESGSEQPDDLKVVSPVDETTPRTVPEHPDGTGDIQLSDSAVLRRLKEYEIRKNEFCKLVESMKKTIREKEQPLTAEDAAEIEAKRSELQKRVKDLGEISVDIHKLIEITNIRKLITSPELKAKFEELFPDMKKDRDVEEKGVSTSLHLMREIVEKMGQQKTLQEEGDDSVPFGGFMKENISKFVSDEDRLPKVVICGNEGPVPRIVVCDSIKKPSGDDKPDLQLLPKQRPKPVRRERDEGAKADSFPHKAVCTCSKKKDKKKDQCHVVQSLKKRLEESYQIQDKLAAESAELEKARYDLQERLLEKDQCLENLQRKVCRLETEMKLMVKENETLKEKASEVSQQEKKVKELEAELLGVQHDFLALQQDREKLEAEKNLLQCSINNCPSLKVSDSCERPGTCDKIRQLNEKLQREIRSRTNDLVTLRMKHEDLTKIAEDLQYKLEISTETSRRLQERLKAAEFEIQQIGKQCTCQSGGGSSPFESRGHMSHDVQRLKNVEEELDEVKNLYEDQCSQLDDYRKKYLAAQQLAEEQARHIEMMDMENNRRSDEFNNELQRVKTHFQEKLADMSPLPDLLKATQCKLQEAQQVRNMAERRCEELTRQLNEANGKLGMNNGADDGRNNLQKRLDAWENKYHELQEQYCKLKAETARWEEIATQSNRRLDEKLQENDQLKKQLETIRDDNSRQYTRSKDRFDVQRRNYQGQLADLERQLVQSRASTRSAVKEKEEVTKRMQGQINCLSQSLGQSQLRNNELQGYVTFLKTSYANVFPGETPSPPASSPKPPGDCTC